MKWLLRIGLLVVLLVVVAAVAAFIMIDSIATASVQKGAAYATETDVEVEKVDVSIFGASATIDGLQIANPEGEYLGVVDTFPDDYKTKFDNFLVLGQGAAEVSAGSVMSDLIEIPKVELSDIEISLVGKDGKKNYEIILESLKRFQGDEPPKETEGEKQVVIKELIIRNITVYYYFDEDPALGAIAVGPKKIVIADDEPMVLTDVGSGGVPMSQITADIITDVMVQVTANLAGDIGDHVLGLTGSLADTVGLENLNGTLEELGLEMDVSKQLGKLKDLGVDIGGGAEDVIKGVGDVVGGLGGLGGDKEDKDGEEGSGEDEEDESLIDKLPF